jgi:hypothetical protein
LLVLLSVRCRCKQGFYVLPVFVPFEYVAYMYKAKSNSGKGVVMVMVGIQMRNLPSHYYVLYYVVCWTNIITV